MALDLLALAASIAFVLTVAAIVAGALQLSRRRADAIAERLADPIVAPPISWKPPSEGQRPRNWVSGFAEALSVIARPGRAEEVARIRARLQCAGFRGEAVVTRFLLTKLVLAFSLLGIALAWNARRVDASHPALLIGVVAFAAGFYLPDAVVASRVRQRRTAIERGLADALDLLVTCVEAGLGLDAALQRVAREVRLAHPLLGEELSTTFLETKAGIPRTEAFRRLANRTGVKDLKSLAATLNQTDLFGTSVALALRVQAEGIRTRRMQRAEERAGFVAVRMALPLVLCILPALVAIVAGPAVINILQILPTLARRN
jgi:tight adherence protein C